MIDKSRPRRGHMYIEPNDNGINTTPLGSNLNAPIVCYIHTIPSGFSSGEKSRPRRGHMFITKTLNNGNTTPLGSNHIANNIFYIHSIPSGLIKI